MGHSFLWADRFLVLATFFNFSFFPLVGPSCILLYTRVTPLSAPFSMDIFLLLLKNIRLKREGFSETNI